MAHRYGEQRTAATFEAFSPEPNRLRQLPCWAFHRQEADKPLRSSSRALIVINAGVPSEAARIMAAPFKNRAIVVAKALKIPLKKGQEPGRGTALAGNSNS